jgi:hypothetical protein
MEGKLTKKPHEIAPSSRIKLSYEERRQARQARTLERLLQGQAIRAAKREGRETMRQLNSEERKRKRNRSIIEERPQAQQARTREKDERYRKRVVRLWEKLAAKLPAVLRAVERGDFELAWRLLEGWLGGRKSSLYRPALRERISFYIQGLIVTGDSKMRELIEKYGVGILDYISLEKLSALPLEIARSPKYQGFFRSPADRERLIGELSRTSDDDLASAQSIGEELVRRGLMNPEEVWRALSRSAARAVRKAFLCWGPVVAKSRAERFTQQGLLTPEEAEEALSGFGIKKE